MSKAQRKLLDDLERVIRRHSGSDYDPEVVVQVLSRAVRRARAGHLKLNLVRPASVSPAAPHEIVREQRRRVGLTLSALARRADIAQPNLSAIENGKRTIGPTTARKLAKALQIDYRTLL